MSSRKILVAEDDANIRAGLTDALEGEGYAVETVADGKAALAAFEKRRPDLVLLDIMMPEISGYDVCRAIRRSDTRVPIILLTAKGEEVDKVVGLELGADDYVTKPFGLRELLARIAAALRRGQSAPPGPATAAPDLPDRIAFGAAVVDRRTYTATCGGRTEGITARERKLIELFVSRPNEVLGRDELLNRVWGLTYYGTTRTLDQHIAQLRKKIEKNPDSPSAILTVHGVGYRYVPQAPAPEESRAGKKPARTDRNDGSRRGACGR